MSYRHTFMLFDEIPRSMVEQFKIIGIKMLMIFLLLCVKKGEYLYVLFKIEFTI
jgi:hypothetical protein